MTLKEAIEHAKIRAIASSELCAKEHAQLAKWLEELQRLRKEKKKVRRQRT